MTAHPGIGAPSPLFLSIAERYLGRFFSKHFSGLRIAVDARPPALAGPVIFYANHPAWWDPIVLLLVIRKSYPDWQFHGPIDEAALDRYRWLEHLGLFGVRPDSVHGYRRFIDAGDTLLQSDRKGLVMTAQGRFVDVRERPVILRRGVTHLLRRHAAARACPIALEYVFWNERLPEVLVRFGQRAVMADGRPIETIHDELQQALEIELDELARQAGARDAGAFRTVVSGQRGTGFLADLPLRIRSFVRREPFDPAHAAIRRSSGSTS